MALYRGVSYKQLFSAPEMRWSNVYTIDTASALFALAAMETIVDAERSVHGAGVRFYRYTARLASGAGETSQINIDEPGLVVSIDVPNMIPLFNTVRVLFTGSVQRPEIKYLRGCMAEANVNGFSLTGEVKDAIQTNYADVLLAILAYVGPDGDDHVGASVQSLIQMRQLSWSRRPRPGFVRGWVPV